MGARGAGGEERGAEGVLSCDYGRFGGMKGPLAWPCCNDWVDLGYSEPKIVSLGNRWRSRREGLRTMMTIEGGMKDEERIVTDEGTDFTN